MLPDFPPKSLKFSILITVHLTWNRVDIISGDDVVDSFFKMLGFFFPLSRISPVKFFRSNTFDIDEWL